MLKQLLLKVSVRGTYTQHHFQFHLLNCCKLELQNKRLRKNKGCHIQIIKRINLTSDIVFEEYGKIRSGRFVSKRKNDKFKFSCLKAFIK